jgi:hypothetical protein
MVWYSYDMKTTIEISDELYRELAAEAARQGKTVPEFVEQTLEYRFRSRQTSVSKASPAFTTISNKQELQAFLATARRSSPVNPGPLPTFNGGGLLVDIADRNKLYDIQ